MRRGRTARRHRHPRVLPVDQELPELTMSIELPPGTSKRDVLCKIGPQRLTAGVRGLPPLVEGELHVRVKADEAMWPCRTRTGWW